MKNKTLFPIWKRHCTSPFTFPMNDDTWFQSMYEDTDSDGRKLFSELITESINEGMVQYGTTAFGFDCNGGISDSVHYNVIRILGFSQDSTGTALISTALAHFPKEERVYAFFHYFGMSACGRHGKLHESQPRVERLLLENGFIVEHQNMYYSKTLSKQDLPCQKISLNWKELSPGSCREFSAVSGGQEIGWGQVHFLPQGDIAYLRWIYIDQKLQHQGFGTAVMQTLFAELFQIGIRRFDTDTALENTIAQAYYEKNGFSNKGITRSYYTK